MMSIFSFNHRSMQMANAGLALGDVAWPPD
jgi:hypothetical protein